MALFDNKYPYTDFHELNLDFLLREQRNLKDYVYAQHGSFDGSINPVNSVLYGRPIIPDEREFVDLETLTYNDFITMWDELAETNSQYMTKETWTDEISGYKNYIYNWKARNIDMVGVNSSAVSYVVNYETQRNMKPGITIVGAMHGNEKSGIWSFYHFFLWCLDPANQVGQWILDNYSFRIAPVVNIYGFNNNTRNNGNGVNINRNFPYDWESASDTDKGPAPLSEWETRFLQYGIIEAYDNSDRYTWPIFDLHGHNYYMHDDKRVLWYSSSSEKLKFAALYMSSFLHAEIVKRYPELEVSYANVGNPELQEVFTRWTSPVSSPTFDNEAREHGIQDILTEVPQEFVQGQEYSEKGQWISDLIVWNTVVNILDYSRISPQGETFFYLYEIGLNKIEGYTLEDICERVPRGSRLIINCGQTHYLNVNGYLPTHNGEIVSGILEVQKSGLKEESNTCVMTFTSYSTSYTYQWIASRSYTGKMHPWIAVNDSMTGYDAIRLYNYINETDLTEETINFSNILSVIPPGVDCEFYVSTTSFPYAYSEIGVRPGMVKIMNPESHGLFRKYAELITDRHEVWCAYFDDPDNIDVKFVKSSKNYTNDDISANTNICTDWFLNAPNGAVFSGYYSATGAQQRGITPPADINFATYTLQKINSISDVPWGIMICQTAGSSSLSRFVCRVDSNGTQGAWSEIVLS